MLMIPNATSDLPGNEGEDRGVLQGEPEDATRFLGLNPDMTIAGPRRRPEGDEGRHVRPRRGVDHGDPGREDAVRDRPAAVPTGIPAGRIREAVRDEPEHRRQRRSGADRARASSTRRTPPGWRRSRRRAPARRAHRGWAGSASPTRPRPDGRREDRDTRDDAARHRLPRRRRPDERVAHVGSSRGCSAAGHRRRSSAPWRSSSCSLSRERGQLGGDLSNWSRWLNRRPSTASSPCRLRC